MDALKNFVKVEASTGYDSSATSVVLKAGDGAKLPDPAVANYNLVWWNSTDYADPADDPYVSIVRVTGKVTDTLTVVQPSSATGNNYNGETSSNTAQNHNTADKVYKLMLAPTYRVFKDIGDSLATIPVKASSAEVTTGTDDAKFVTALAAQGVKKLIAAPGVDHTVSGITCVLNANENQAFGDVCYIDADGQAHLIDADAIASMSGLFMCADASISANADGTYLALGFARDDTWNWTVGGLIYGTVTGTTGNTLSQTAPTGTDDVVQIIGVATHADRMFFNPQLVQVEHA